ncbi:hypothetical protein [Amycolatopsis lexingtonensis]|nr:hypothetical protein [Amycolatopsis lexingtonensis]
MRSIVFSESGVSRSPIRSPRSAQSITDAAGATYGSTTVLRHVVFGQR